MNAFFWALIISWIIARLDIFSEWMPNPTVASISRNISALAAFSFTFPNAFSIALVFISYTVFLEMVLQKYSFSFESIYSSFSLTFAFRNSPMKMFANCCELYGAERPPTINLDLSSSLASLSSFAYTSQTNRSGSSKNVGYSRFLSLSVFFAFMRMRLYVPPRLTSASRRYRLVLFILSFVCWKTVFNLAPSSFILNVNSLFPIYCTPISTIEFSVQSLNSLSVRGIKRSSS
mmetsp:Transcript_13004/g.16168  ORF Transcript_13004/g.16168 Transcript_13004/m.16168 type:complete len:233 (-) Transcript_13004:718-1416(-)